MLPRARGPPQEKPLQGEDHALQLESGPHSLQLENSPRSHNDNPALKKKSTFEKKRERKKYIEDTVEKETVHA